MSTIRTSSAQGIVLLNAQLSTFVVLVQLFFPYYLYESPILKWISESTNLPQVHLTPATSPAHALSLSTHIPLILHLWISAFTTRRHSHVSTALIDIAYALPALLSCTPLFPSQYGSSVAVMSSLSNLAFGVAICWKGGFGWRDFVGLFGGDEGIRGVDVRKRNTENSKD